MNKSLPNQLSDKIVNWWAFFMEAECKISDYFVQAIDFNVVEFMQDNLQCIDKNLMWEFGPAILKKGHRLVITSEYRKDLRPLVNAILQSAPELSDWEFYGYRLPESFESAKSIVKAKTGHCLSNVYFLATRNEFNLIDLTFIFLNIKDETTVNIAQNQAVVILEYLLGEEVFDKWIGTVNIETCIPEDESHKPISQLNSSVKNEIAAIKSALPDNCFYERVDETEWVFYELTPDEKPEYPRQDDLLFAKTVCAPLWENTKCNCLFSSERFSKSGEIFCYLKIYRSDTVQNESIETKSPFEESIDEALIPAKLGCTIGAGVGLQYSYIELALIDLVKAVEVIKIVLQKANITKKSWIQFFDSELEAQWIGIWDDSPHPPMPNFGHRCSSAENH